MKICVISFDYWNYDQHIVKALQKKGVTASHIDISKFKYEYKSVFEKLKNFLFKVFLNKNIKKIKRQEFIIETLQRLGKQDQILVIRPDLIERKTHQTIKGYTDNYMAYIYDSCKRFPIDHLLEGVFDRIYSFDREDVKAYNFEHITNYIYLDKQPISDQFEFDVFIVMSPDERIHELNVIAKQLDQIGASYKFIVVSRKRPSHLYEGIEHTSKEIGTNELKTYIQRSRIILDLLRENHNGMSFRIFEALAYQKKIITTNSSVKHYDFYDENNILILEKGKLEINEDFFKTQYEPLDDDIYDKYTVSGFVERVFKLQE